ncbi:PREDICTED: myosin-2 heavy chain [Camelina sativa]|uniref:Myosin-2 heavy chain n=1 Tax=Camelina sativa TaxID=90675 RepID=A0ABM0VVV7_CAMSA|nr:PREDICTED: myosin-2 heavy chain [Camelina sativa]
MIKAAMDLGCLDLGCLSSLSDKKTAAVGVSDPLQFSSSPSKSCKNKSPREISSEIRKSQSKRSSSQRKTSPLGWFPRSRKGDSYLNRKIKKLQEVGGMNQTLDETLGDSNPHYCKIVREQMAVREAAGKAMELRKAALVEAPWCRILRAARIPCTEAETLMENAEKAAVEAFEAASAMGVIMHDKPNSSRKQYRIETSGTHGRGSPTHTVTASFDTAFDVDKEVAAAVKTAFARLANSPSVSKAEFRDLLKKISEHPEVRDNHEITEMSSECDTESDSELDILHKVDEEVAECEETSSFKTRQLKVKRRQSFGKFSREKLLDMLLERLQGLQEDHLSSLASVVATCGLNEALRGHTTSINEPTVSDHGNSSSMDIRSRRDSKCGSLMEGKTTRNGTETEIPSLDKYLVKHMTKLEREVYEAKRDSKENSDKDRKVPQGVASDPVPDLGSIFVKHSSRLEKEVEEAKKNAGMNSRKYQKNSSRNKTSMDPIQDLESLLVKKHVSGLEKDVRETIRNCGKMYENVKKPGKKESSSEVPSLDSCLVKHVSKLEKEVQDAKKRNQEELDARNLETVSRVAAEELGKENVDLNNKAEGQEESLDKILVKPVHRLEREKVASEAFYGNRRIQRRKQAAKTDSDYESLDKILVKHVPKLEKEKQRFKTELEETENSVNNNEGSLDQTLEKHNQGPESTKTAKPILTRQQMRDIEIQETWGGLGLGESKINSQKRLEIKKTEATEHLGEERRPILTRRQARDKEMLEAWGGLGLGDSSLHQNKQKTKPETEKTEKAIPLSTRRKARDREMQEAWGGLDLGNSIRPSLSKLEREKAAWIKAEKEETTGGN